MKKIILIIIVLLGTIGTTKAQIIILDSIRGEQHIPYCDKVDKITLIAPDGATDVVWNTSYSCKKEGNNLVVFNVHPIAKYGDEILCTYTKGNVKNEKKYITLHMLSIPTEPKFSSCTVNGSITLNADMDMDVWGFTHYQWSNGSTEKSIEVTISGTYTVTISNLCGVVTHTATINIITPKEKENKIYPKPKKLRNVDDVKKSGLKHWWMVWKYEHLGNKKYSYTINSRFFSGVFLFDFFIAYNY